jgi:hypothetical protein
MTPPKPRRPSRTPMRRAIDETSAHILRYLNATPGRPVVDEENEAILDYLFTPTKKNRPQR